MKIHYTVGVYPNGDMKHNGVSENLLTGHIEYNKTWRPGRALFVDGELVYSGCVSVERLAEAKVKIGTTNPFTKDTRPYQ